MTKIMSHARLRNAVIAGGWPTRTTSRTTTTAVAASGQSVVAGGGGGGAVGMVTAGRRCVEPARSSTTPISLLQPVIPSRGMAASAAAAGESRKVLTEDNVFINLRRMEYAVRGPLLLRALEIEKELQKVR